MEYLLLWLFLGQTGYIFALSIRVYQLNDKVEGINHNMSIKSFVLGLAAILLGPLVFFLIDYKKDN